MVGTAKPTAVVDAEAELVAALRAERGRKRGAERAARRRRRREALHTMELEDQGGDGRSATSAAVAAVEMVDDSLHDEWADEAPTAGLMDVDEPAGAVAAVSAGGAGAAAAVVAVVVDGGAQTVSLPSAWDGCQSEGPEGVEVLEEVLVVKEQVRGKGTHLGLVKEAGGASEAPDPSVGGPPSGWGSGGRGC